MNRFTTTILALLSFTLLGCEEITLEDDNTTTSKKDKNGLPKIFPTKGISVKLEDYLFPSSLTQNKTFYADIYPYKQDTDGKITTQIIVEKSITKRVNTLTDTQIIIEFIDDIETQRNHITDKDIQYSKNNNILEEYPLKVATNNVTTEVDIDGITKRCVVRSIGAKDLLPLLPTFIQNDLKTYLTSGNGEFEIDQFSHANLMYIECGTTSLKTIDTYYSDKYGEVLKIQKDTVANTAEYEILDVKSVEIR